MNFVNQNIPEYKVSEISAAIKYKIEESFGYVKIKGEVSGLAVKNSQCCFQQKNPELLC